MLALTLIQPWGSLIIDGHKPIENRDWLPPPSMLKPGGRFAIHAGKQVDHDVLNFAWDTFGIEIAQHQIHGAILGTVEFRGAVELVERPGREPEIRVVCGPADLLLTLHPIELKWLFGQYGWVLRNVRKLDIPIPCRGALKLWTVPEVFAQRITEAEARRAA